MHNRDQLIAWRARWREVNDATDLESAALSTADRLRNLAQLRTLAAAVPLADWPDDEPAVWARFQQLRSRSIVPETRVDDALSDALVALAQWLSASRVPYALIDEVAVALQAVPSLHERHRRHGEHPQGGRRVRHRAGNARIAE